MEEVKRTFERKPKEDLFHEVTFDKVSWDNVFSKIYELRKLAGKTGKIYDLKITDRDDVISYIHVDKPNARQEIKYGRFLNSLETFFPKDVFNEHNVEMCVNRYKGFYKQYKENSRFRLVDGLAINRWYLGWNYTNRDRGSPLHSSCMRGIFSQLKFRIYAENPDKINLLILTDDNNKLLGRAIVWKLDEPAGRTYMDRIYYSNYAVQQMFINYARQNKWLMYDDKQGWAPNNIFKVYVKRNYGHPRFNPYMDTMRYFYTEGNKYFLSNYENVRDKVGYNRLPMKRYTCAPFI
jgi:hypothetical protein